MAKSKLLKGDIVKVIAGSHKGESGPITWISKDKTRVSVQGIEVSKHQKPSQADTEGGIKQIPATIHISNVALVDPKKKDTATRVGYQINDGKKERFAKKSGQVIK
ncbi:50S ribosomal protein L24 [Mesoplasma lactucae]|uniref:Large ribosomal subunit protein uL24 n=1 Tax=Mesoplasma lactucae ATCC 49193 TaxID=81460 RepID=A0A291IR67_9MOLU|nr:50S ribosomal protein L24 [Mesoplasma lactucae]ATG97181.1 50S ribosomal protein L24 [Mesoplasma lactucae ATCC 49193]ATZ20379.1 50S ribosomal protein L24 [Mesoplasma lactucae ATCC 49193]MCL8216550.1 50S ribosomal protein L24 [Mesoplasma lactucae ATCC 49193]